MRIVVTGGMGCGKSTIVRSLVTQLPNYSLFDFDSRVHELYDDPIIRAQLLDAFGVASREEIRRLVYHNKYAMATLGGIMNKRLIQDVVDAANTPNIIMDIPLFFEMADTLRQPLCCVDLVIGVYANKNVQYQRIQARNGYSVEFIDKILEHQLSSDEKIRRSDVSIDTSLLTLDGVDSLVSRFISNNGLE